MNRSRRESEPVPTRDAQGLIKTLDALVRLCESGSLPTYEHSPGTVHPSDDAMFALDPPEDEPYEDTEEIEQEEDLLIEPEDPEEGPEASIEEGKEPPSPEPIQLHPQTAPELEPEPETEPDNEPEQVQDSGDPKESHTWEELLAFARVLASPPLARNIQDLGLRRLVTELITDDIFIHALSIDEVDHAKDLLEERMRGLRALLESVDARLQETSAPQATLSPEDTVARIVSNKLDTLITASVLRLPQQLQRFRLDALTLRAQHHESERVFIEERETFILEHRQVISVVAEIDRAFRKREETRLLERHARTLFETLLGRIGEMERRRIRASELASELHALEERSYESRDHAARTIRGIHALQRSAADLGVELPFEIREQMSEAIAPLEAGIEGCTDCFSAPHPLESDGQLDDAMALTLDQQRRLEHILNPIRPSVFRTRLDRDEELKRLALITFHLLTRQGARIGQKVFPNQQHDGFARKSVAFGILPASNFVDSSESERINEHIWELKEAGLLETNKVHRSWRYRPTGEGVTLAKRWLAECLDEHHLDTQVDVARRAHGQTQRKERKARRKSS